MTQWIKKRTTAEAREIAGDLDYAERSRLTLRLMNELPPISELYVERHCPSLVKKVRRYSAERARACCDEDIDRLAHIRYEIEQEAIEAQLDD